MLRPNNRETPLQDSILEETSHRHSQVVKVSRNTNEQGRELSEQPACRPELEQQGVVLEGHQDQSPTAAQLAQEDWLELARVGGLLPIPLANSLLPNTTSLSLEQQAEALSREHRLARLERRYLILSVFLGMLLVGTTVVHTLSILHETGRHEQMIAQLQQGNAEQRSAQEQERVRLNSRISLLDARVVAMNSKLNGTLRTDATPPKVVSTAPVPKAQLSMPPQTPVAKEATDSAATKEATDSAATKEATDSAATKEATDSATSTDVSKPANLRDAMKSAVSKDAPQSPKPVDAPLSARKACDKSDPLCGDVT